MSLPLPPEAQRVQDFLTRSDSSSHVRFLPQSTATARDAANALGVSVNQIGKSIVFGSTNETFVVVLCGDQKVDVDLLVLAVGRIGIKQLSATEVKLRTGYIIGGVSPFALPQGVKVIIDSRLRDCEDCYVAAGHPKAVVQTNGRELQTLVAASVQRIAV